jgi:hypothetical protein
MLNFEHYRLSGDKAPLISVMETNIPSKYLVIYKEQVYIAEEAKLVSIPLPALTPTSAAPSSISTPPTLPIYSTKAYKDPSTADCKEFLIATIKDLQHTEISPKGISAKGWKRTKKYKVSGTVFRDFEHTDGINVQVAENNDNLRIDKLEGLTIARADLPTKKPVPIDFF